MYPTGDRPQYMNHIKPKTSFKRPDFQTTKAVCVTFILNLYSGGGVMQTFALCCIDGKFLAQHVQLAY